MQSVLLNQPAESNPKNEHFTGEREYSSDERDKNPKTDVELAPKISANRKSRDPSRDAVAARTKNANSQIEK